MFPPSTELVVERARRERRRPDLFIGQLAGAPAARYFSWSSLSSMRVCRLTSSGHIAMAGARPCARQSALAGLWWLGMVATMAPTIDAFIVREKREKRRKEGRRGVSLLP